MFQRLAILLELSDVSCGEDPLLQALIHGVGVGLPVTVRSRGMRPGLRASRGEQHPLAIAPPAYASDLVDLDLLLCERSAEFRNGAGLARDDQRPLARRGHWVESERLADRQNLVRDVD